MQIGYLVGVVKGYMRSHSKNGLYRMTSKQARRLFEVQVRRSLGMKTDEFIHRLRTGRIKVRDRSEAMRLAMMIPLGR